MSGQESKQQLPQYRSDTEDTGDYGETSTVSHPHDIKHSASVLCDANKARADEAPADEDMDAELGTGTDMSGLGTLAKWSNEQYARRSPVSARKRAKKPTDMPRRPLSKYNLFFREQREVILRERRQKAQKSDSEALSSSTDLFSKMGKTIAERWKNITPEDLERLEELAHAEQAKYKAAMERYTLDKFKAVMETDPKAKTYRRQATDTGEEGALSSGTDDRKPAAKLAENQEGQSISTIKTARSGLELSGSQQLHKSGLSVHDAISPNIPASMLSDVLKQQQRLLQLGQGNDIAHQLRLNNAFALSGQTSAQQSRPFDGLPGTQDWRLQTNSSSDNRTNVNMLHPNNMRNNEDALLQNLLGNHISQQRQFLHHGIAFSAPPYSTSQAQYSFTPMSALIAQQESIPPQELNDLHNLSAHIQLNNAMSQHVQNQYAASQSNSMQMELNQPNQYSISSHNSAFDNLRHRRLSQYNLSPLAGSNFSGQFQYDTQNQQMTNLDRLSLLLAFPSADNNAQTIQNMQQNLDLAGRNEILNNFASNNFGSLGNRDSAISANLLMQLRLNEGRNSQSLQSLAASFSNARGDQNPISELQRILGDQLDHGQNLGTDSGKRKTEDPNTKK